MCVCALILMRQQNSLLCKMSGRKREPSEKPNLGCVSLFDVLDGKQ